MRTGLAAFVVGLAALCAAPSWAGCTLHMFGSIPLEVDGSRALVKTTVNDKPANFILDTGAYISSMTRPDAKRLGVRLDNKDYGSEGIGGGVSDTEGFMVLKIGDVLLPHEAMMVMDLKSLDHDAVGLLGLDLLAQHDLELDLPAKSLHLLQLKGCTPADLASWASDKVVNQVSLQDSGEIRPEILFQVALNGHLIPAQLDSGSPQTTVTLAAAQAARADLTSARKVDDIGGVGQGRISAAIARFDTFSIGGETIRNARIVVSDMWKYNRRSETGTRLGAQEPEFFRPRMLLGQDFLRAHRVLIANSVKQMAFTYVGGPVFDIQTETQPAAPPSGPSPPTKPAAQP